MGIINLMWLLLCGVLVCFMQAGFAMLEAGFVRSKNVANIAMKNIMDICIGAPLFIVLGFGIMYGKGNAFIGSLDILLNESYESVLPMGVTLEAFIFFQLIFCATAATIVSGAMAERTRFAAYCVYSAVISAVVYPVVGHWIWGGGWLNALGFHDFAGGTLVHTVGGMSALTGAVMVGPRLGKYDSDKKAKAIHGHNITLSALGIFILWFGWYGFNGGSVLTSTGSIADAAGGVFLKTTVAAAVSAVFATLTSRYKFKKTDVSMTINGILAGLVSITAGCDKVSLTGAFVIGAVAGIVVVNSIGILDKVFKVDDPVGAVSAHGVSGILGTLMTGLFATDKGLFYTGNAEFFGVQLLGSVVVTASMLAVMTIVFKLIDITVGLRVASEVEMEGLDIHEHGFKNACGDYLFNDYIEDDNKEALDKIIKDLVVPIEEAVPIQNVSERGAVTGLAKVEIIIRQSKFEILKAAMEKIGVTGMTVSHVFGCGIQKGRAEYYRGAPIDMQLLPKIKVEIVVAKVPVELLIETARKVLYTGHIGDGKIFVYDVIHVVKIRTGAVDYDAMQGLQD